MRFCRHVNARQGVPLAGKIPKLRPCRKSLPQACCQIDAARPAPSPRRFLRRKRKLSQYAGQHVFLVDGSGYIFRAYHALPPLTRKSDGLPVGAVLGFCNMLWKLLRDMPKGDEPTHLAVIFDKSEKTFRNELYPTTRRTGRRRPTT